MVKKVEGIVILVLVLALVAGCKTNDNYSAADFVKVLDTSQDYNEYKSDFKKSFGRDFEPVLILNTTLNSTVVAQKLNSNDTTVITELYTNLPDKTLHEVRMSDRSKSERSIVAVLDMKNKEVMKFFALISIQMGAKLNLTEGN